MRLIGFSDMLPGDGMDTGKKVQIFRKRHSLTQQQLADKVGVSKSVIGNLERNNKLPSFDVMLRITNELDMPTPIVFRASE